MPSPLCAKAPGPTPHTPPSHHCRPITHSSVPALQSASEYIRLQTSPARRAHVPPPRGVYKDVGSILVAIGRNAQSVSGKFTGWNHFFTATSSSMKDELGITDAKLRKYILGWREWYKQGYDPVTIEIPKRRKKFLKVRAKVQQVRLKKQGLV
ncbi:hypothetical protein SeMB42_g07363 [Synchytrium endobioticum]|nr:hypothetical protein SeMB42_g07363 [Synchytrium endobioticum]